MTTNLKREPDALRVVRRVLVQLGIATLAMLAGACAGIIVGWATLRAFSLHVSDVRQMANGFEAGYFFLAIVLLVLVGTLFLYVGMILIRPLLRRLFLPWYRQLDPTHAFFIAAGLGLRSEHDLPAHTLAAAEREIGIVRDRE